MGRSLIIAERDKMHIAPTAIRYSMAKRLAIYTDVQAGIPYKEICVRQGVAMGTVSNIAHDQQLAEMVDPHVAELRKKSLSALSYYVADLGLSSIEYDEIKKLNPLQRTIMAATAIDKARLMAGESTENLSVKGVVEGLNSELTQMRERRQELQRRIRESDIVSTPSEKEPL